MFIQNTKAYQHAEFILLAPLPACGSTELAYFQNYKKQMTTSFLQVAHLLVLFCVLGAAVTFSPDTVSSTGRREPKKSVIRTLWGSRENRSFLTPTVEMQTLLGQTASWNKIIPQHNQHWKWPHWSILTIKPAKKLIKFMKICRCVCITIELTCCEPDGIHCCHTAWYYILYFSFLSLCKHQCHDLSAVECEGLGFKMHQLDSYFNLNKIQVKKSIT